MLTYLLWQFNKNNKPADRAIVITDKLIYKLDPKKKYKPLKKGIPISMVSDHKMYMVKNYLKGTIYKYIKKKTDNKEISLSMVRNNTKGSV